jgi:hypothetical protein
MTIEARYMFRPRPGTSIEDVMSQSKMAAELWRKYKGEVSLWTVTSGEMGNWIFSVKFPNYESYGTCLSELSQDPDFLTMQDRFMTSGKADWIRSNVVRQIQI